MLEVVKLTEAQARKYEAEQREKERAEFKALEEIYYNLEDGKEYGYYYDPSNPVIEEKLFWWVLCGYWSNGKHYIGWRNFGQSANKFNKRELRWVLQIIFKMTPSEFIEAYDCK